MANKSKTPSGHYVTLMPVQHQQMPTLAAVRIALPIAKGHFTPHGYLVFHVRYIIGIMWTKLWVWAPIIALIVAHTALAGRLIWVSQATTAWDMWLATPPWICCSSICQRPF